MIIGNVATYPARGQKGISIIEQISKQVDQLNVAFNEYESIPRSIASLSNVNAIIPDQDYKDVGKFIFDDYSDDDVIFLFDDDIIYPRNYVTEMEVIFESIPINQAVIGLHGVMYSDFFDGLQGSRCVYPFNLKNDKFRVVNQLGTGTVLCKGKDMPPKSFMENSERFVDVRFAAYQKSNGTPLICIPRSNKWLKESTTSESIFSTFTHEWPVEVVREAIDIGGFSKLDLESVKCIAEWEAQLNIDSTTL